MRNLGTSLPAMALAASLAFGIGSCSKPKKKTEATASASASASAPEKASIKGDPELVAALEAMVEGCQIDEKSARVRTCKNKEKRTLTGMFARRKKDRAASLETFVNALESDDEKLRIVAANVLHSAFRSSWGSGDIKLDPAIATRLRTLVGTLEPKLAIQVIPAAVHASLIAKQDKELFAFLDAPEHKSLRVSAYRHLMAHGRMRVFPKVKEIVAGPEIGAAAAALGSARAMMGATKEEKKQLCDWSLEVLKDPRGAVASKAGALLISCRDKYIDALLAEGEARLKKKTFDGAFARAFRTICNSSGGRRETAGSEAQCKKTRQLLNKVLKAKSADSVTKGTALMAMAMQWPDEKTQKLAEQLEKSDDKLLATRAKQALRHMERRARRERAAQATVRKRPIPLGNAKPNLKDRVVGTKNATPPSSTSPASTPSQ